MYVVRRARLGERRDRRENDQRHGVGRTGDRMPGGAEQRREHGRHHRAVQAVFRRHARQGRERDALGQHDNRAYQSRTVHLNAKIKVRITELLDDGNGGKHEVRRIADLVKIVYVRQPSPRGDGDAILCARSVVGDEPFAVMFGDDLVDGDTPALRQLMSVYYEKHAPVVAMQQVAWDRVSNYGIVHPRQRDGRTFQLQDLVEKPPREQAPSNYAVIGKYIVTPELLDALERARALSDNAELKLIDGLREYVRMSPIYGYELSGRRYDTGNKLDFLKATVDFALKRPDLGEAFRKYLATLDFQGHLGYNDVIRKTKTNNAYTNGNAIQQLSNGGRIPDERIRSIAPGSGREEIEWPTRGGYRDLREDSPYGP